MANILYIINTRRFTMSIDIGLNVIESVPLPYDGLYTELNKYIDNAQLYQSNESLTTAILGVVDIFSRIIFTFKTNTTRFTKKLKRSEIRFYYESHITTCKLVENTNYAIVMDDVVPVPRNFNTTYLEAVNYLNNAWKLLNLKTESKKINEFLQKLLVNVARNETSSMGYIVTEASVLNNTIKTIHNNDTQWFSKYWNNPKNSNGIVFKNVFKSMNDFKETRIGMYKNEVYLLDAHHMLETINETENNLSSLVKMIDNTKVFSPDTLKKLATYVYHAGKAYELYGTWCTYEEMLEHNYILVSKHILDRIK